MDISGTVSHWNDNLDQTTPDQTRGHNTANILNLISDLFTYNDRMWGVESYLVEFSFSPVNDRLCADWSVSVPDHVVNMNLPVSRHRSEGGADTEL